MKQPFMKKILTIYMIAIDLYEYLELDKETNCL